jgi:hypothetical protein
MRWLERIEVDRILKRSWDDFQNTNTRTFKIFPGLALAYETLRRNGVLSVDMRFAPLLIFGYYQHRLIGRYRTRQGGGGGSFENLPDKLVQEGPYAFTRNPMYLGDLIFTLGLALILRSKASLLLLLVNAVMLHQRVLEDEERLRQRFGPEYDEYCRRVKRWLPYLF